MSRAGGLLESYRGAYQVFITPHEDSVVVRFADDTVGNDDLRFPPTRLSHSEFFEVIPHNSLTQETFQLALERGDTYGIFVSPMVVSRLARKGVPGDTPMKYQHTHNRQYPTEKEWARDGMMSART
jgi:hypothetical protein